MVDMEKTIEGWDLGDLMLTLAALTQLRALERAKGAAGDVGASPAGAAGTVGENPFAGIGADADVSLEHAKELRYWVSVAHGAYADSIDELVRRTSFTHDDIVHFERKGGVLRPVFYVAVCHKTRSIVTCIRGTYALSDAIINAVAAPEFCGSLGYAHRGMVRSGDEVTDRVTPWLHELQRRYPTYRLTCVGHSLGGAAAAFMAMRLRHSGEFPDIRAFAFSPAACMSLQMAEACREYVTSVVCGDDFVPRLAVAPLERLREDLTEVDWRVVLRHFAIDEVRQLRIAAKAKAAYRERGSHLADSAAGITAAVTQLLGQADARIRANRVLRHLITQLKAITSKSASNEPPTASSSTDKRADLPAVRRIEQQVQTLLAQIRVLDLQLLRRIPEVLRLDSARRDTVRASMHVDGGNGAPSDDDSTASQRREASGMSAAVDLLVKVVDRTQRLRDELEPKLRRSKGSATEPRLDDEGDGTQRVALRARISSLLDSLKATFAPLLPAKAGSSRKSGGNEGSVSDGDNGRQVETRARRADALEDAELERLAAEAMRHVSGSSRVRQGVSSMWQLQYFPPGVLHYLRWTDERYRPADANSGGDTRGSDSPAVAAPSSPWDEEPEPDYMRNIGVYHDEDAAQEVSRVAATGALPQHEPQPQRVRLVECPDNAFFQTVILSRYMFKDHICESIEAAIDAYVEDIERGGSARRRC